MSYFHYEPVNTAFGLKKLTSFEEDETQVIQWLRPYKLTVSEKELMLEIARKCLLANSEAVGEDLADYFFIHARVYEILSKNSANWI